VAAGALPSTPTAWTVLALLGLPAGVLVAGYTAFLFGQAEGRDLWQSPLLFWHLVVQALMVGAGSLLAVGWILPTSHATPVAEMVFLPSCLLHVAFLLVEYLGHHRTAGAVAAARMVTRGRYSRWFWFGAVVPPLVAAAAALPAWPAATACAGLVVQASLLVYESVFVRAGQDVPLS
jgi:Ni/Fe-hydrogenase subunit HybB-like protein